MQNFHLTVLILILLAEQSTLAEVISGNLGNVVQFLEKPPSQLEFLFSIDEIGEGKTDFYWVLWQTNGMIVRKGKTADGAIGQVPYAEREAAGMCADQFWTLENGIIRVMDIPPASNVSPSSTNRSSLAKVMPICYEGKVAICLGIPSVEPGSLKWNGFLFAANGVDGIVRGKLKRNALGNADSMEIFVAYLNGFLPSSIIYTYKSKLSIPFLPSGWECRIPRGASSQTLRRYRILWIRTNSFTDSPERFSYRNVLNYDVTGFIFYTNHSELRLPYDRHKDKYMSVIFGTVSPADISVLWRYSSVAFTTILSYFFLRSYRRLKSNGNRPL